MKLQFMRRWGLVFVLTLQWHLAVPRASAAGHTAQMRLTLDARGNVAAYLVVFVLPEDPKVLQAALQQALGLSVADVDWDIDEHKHVVTLSGHSATSFPHQLLRVHGTIDLRPLQQLFQRLGITEFSGNLTHPRCGFTSCVLSARTLQPQLSWNTEYSWNTPVGAAAAAPLRFDFGYAGADVLRIVGVLLALAVAGLAALWWRTRTAAGPDQSFVQSRRELLVLIPLLWAGGLVAVYVLRADVFTWFLMNAETDAAQMAIACVLLWGPLLVLGALAIPRQDSQRRSEDVQVRPGRLLRFGARLHALLLVPTAAVAVGLVDLRDGDSVRAGEWLVLGICSAFVAVAAFTWSNAGQLSRAAAPAGEAEARDLVRVKVIRRVAGELVALICFPAAVLFLIRQARLEDTTRYAALFGVLVGVGLLLLLLRNLLPLGSGAESRAVPAVVQVGGMIVLTLLLAWGACALLRFPFDLTRGDEGWAMLLISGTAALFYWVPQLRRR